MKSLSERERRRQESEQRLIDNISAAREDLFRLLEEMNDRWLQETRPIVEAFFHAKYFLDMICRYADEVKEPQQLLPSGWASVLYLYGLR